MQASYFSTGIKRGEINDLASVYDDGRTLGWGREDFSYCRESFNADLDMP